MMKHIIIQTSSLLKSIAVCEYVIMCLPMLVLMESQSYPYHHGQAPADGILQGTIQGTELLGHRGCIFVNLLGLLVKHLKGLYQFRLPRICIYESFPTLMLASLGSDFCKRRPFMPSLTEGL